MQDVSVRTTKREQRLATSLIRKHALPEGISGFTVEPDEDQYGDPLMVNWLEAKAADHWSDDRVAAFAEFGQTPRPQLYQVLEEYRPHVSLRDS
jgi:hypothetical protein